MSLINDALKRAKEAQRQAPPPASIGPQLKPVESPPLPRSATGMLIPMTLIVATLLALFLLWSLRTRTESGATTDVRAQATSADPDSLSSPSTTEMTSLLSSSSVPKASLAGAKAASDLQSSRQATGPAVGHLSMTMVEAHDQTPTVPRTNQPTAVAVGTGSRAANISTVSDSLSNNQVPTEVAPPKPPPLKLQGVVFDPKRPSAVINGRTVFVGDRVREMRVAAITVNSAILVGSGRTNVLSMAE